MLVLTLLTGIWTTTCIQTQMSNSHSGYVTETYSFDEKGSFEFKREWFSDSLCKQSEGTDTESGTVDIGIKIQSIFSPGNVYEADFHSQNGTDLGAVSVNNRTLKVARGVKKSSFRNTMLSLFEHTKK